MQDTDSHSSTKDLRSDDDDDRLNETSFTNDAVEPSPPATVCSTNQHDGEFYDARSDFVSNTVGSARLIRQASSVALSAQQKIDVFDSENAHLNVHLNEAYDFIDGVQHENPTMNATTQPQEMYLKVDMNCPVHSHFLAPRPSSMSVA
jgi:hypothetical protein